ncbi:Ubiquitin-conjugating enzyme E2 2, partial [Linum perenne]
FCAYSSLTSLIALLESLLRDPNPKSPANLEAARMFSENKREYSRESVRSSGRAGLLIKLHWQC